MKLIKKIATIMLSVMMVLGMASVVNADGTESGTSTVNTGKITINKAIAGQTYRIYKILELGVMIQPLKTMPIKQHLHGNLL